MSFTTETKDGVLIIKMPNSLAKGMAQELEVKIKMWLLEPPKLHVLDFSDTLSIDPSMYRPLTIYKRALTQNNKMIASIGLRDNLQREITAAGMDLTFNRAESLQKARVTAGIDVPQTKSDSNPIDVKLIEPFIQGTLNTLETQASLKIKAGKPQLKAGNSENIAIAGTISFNSPELPGSIALCFTKDVFLAIYEKMVGEKHTDITQETQDAAGEILNIIYGYAKTKLLERNIRIDRAIPVVLVGEKLRMQVGEKGKSIVLPFETDVGPFYIEIAISKKA